MPSQIQHWNVSAARSAIELNCKMYRGNYVLYYIQATIHMVCVESLLIPQYFYCILPWYYSTSYGVHGRRVDLFPNQ